MDRGEEGEFEVANEGPGGNEEDAFITEEDEATGSNGDGEETEDSTGNGSGDTLNGVRDTSETINSGFSFSNSRQFNGSVSGSD